MLEAYLKQLNATISASCSRMSSFAGLRMCALWAIAYATQRQLHLRLTCRRWPLTWRRPVACRLLVAIVSDVDNWTSQLSTNRTHRTRLIVSIISAIVPRRSPRTALYTVVACRWRTSKRQIGGQSAKSLADGGLKDRSGVIVGWGGGTQPLRRIGCVVQVNRLGAPAKAFTANGRTVARIECNGQYVDVARINCHCLLPCGSR